MSLSRVVGVLLFIAIFTNSEAISLGNAEIKSIIAKFERNFKLQQGIVGEDPEVHMNVSQLISSKGYPVELYEVETVDGFILTLQRIPHGIKPNPNPKPVVFLQHGLLCSASNFVVNLANESLAFILADAGYDVWLGNSRGNTYSRKHKKYTPDQEEFWAWSWDEMAKYDLPAMINFTLTKAGKPSLYYIGHSQGTLQAFAQLSHDQELANKIKLFVAMGPVATVGHSISPIKYLDVFDDAFLYRLFGHKIFLPNDEILKFLAEDFCDLKEFAPICTNVLFLIAGFDLKQLNETRLPVYLTHTPAGTSTQNMIHFTQMMRTDKFQMYNYDSAAKNEMHYNQTTPPLYNFDKFKTPVALFWGGHDWLADPTDVKELIKNLKSNVVKSVEIPEWDHLDFIWAVDAKRRAYDEIIKLMKERP